MSKIGKAKIKLPSGVEAKISDSVFSVKGPKGELNEKIFDGFSISIEDSEISVIPPENAGKETPALWGTLRALISNAVIGVSEGYEKKLIVEGIGFKVAIEGKNLVLNLGFSHSINFPIPDGIEMTTEKNTITIKGINKELVGQTAAEIRAFKKPEPYKGKGIRYSDEVVRRKAGKKAVGTA